MKQKQRTDRFLSVFNKNRLSRSADYFLRPMQPIIILLTATILLIGCGKNSKTCPNSLQDQDRHHCKSNHSPPHSKKPDDGTDDNPDSHSETLLHKGEVTQKVELGTLRAGDVLTFEIEGVKVTPKFSQIYTRTYASSWIKHICFPWKNRGQRCFDFPLNGFCEHNQRDKQKDNRENIKISNDLKGLRLRLKIGNAIFGLGEVVKREGDKTTLRLKINPAMLETGDFAELVVEQYPPYTIKVGFQGFGKCDGHGEKNFVTSGPTDSSDITAQVKQLFLVSVTLSYN